MATFFPVEALAKSSPQFAYQVFFTTDDAVITFDKNPRHLINAVFRSVDDMRDSGADELFSNPGHLTEMNPEKLPLSKSLFSNEDFLYYVSNFTQTGFRGSLNLYKTRKLNFDDEKTVLQHRPNDESIVFIEAPVLMITAELDPILRPEFTEGMEEHIPNLKRAHIEGVNHWLLQENPQACFNVLHPWLLRLRGDLPINSSSA